MAYVYGEALKRRMEKELQGTNIENEQLRVALARARWENRKLWEELRLAHLEQRQILATKARRERFRREADRERWTKLSERLNEKTPKRRERNHVH